MRKRFVTTLLICLLTLASVFGFAACGGNNIDIPQGEQVTEEQWKAAFKATINATNYTYELSGGSTTTEKYKNDEGKIITSTSVEMYINTVYLNSDKRYAKLSFNDKATGMKNSEDYEIEGTSEGYVLVEESGLWQCSLSTEKYISGAPENYEEKEAKWSAQKTECTDIESAKQEFIRTIWRTGHMLDGHFLTSQDATEKKALIDLYSAFSYSNGKYAATLYDYSNVCIIEISIKDGYVVGYGEKEIREQIDESFKYEQEYKYVFKDYGSTTINVSADATEAINKAKAE